jgi:uncharacterized protein
LSVGGLSLPIVTTLYAGILGLLSIVIGFGAGGLRGKLNISIGDGGNRDLLLAMRRHANFVEWVPQALILIALLEVNGVSKTAIHVFGASLVIARVCHAVGLKADTIRSLPRMIGAMGTVLLTAVASVWLIVLFVRA